MNLDEQIKTEHLLLEDRVCRTCNISKGLLADFYRIRKDPSLPSSYAYECKTCTTHRVRTRHRKDPTRQRNNDLKRLYGITLSEYNHMLSTQNHCCAICGTDKPGGRWNSFAVDHCHETNKVRGLLCKSCNIMIGEAKDNIDILQKAMVYLENEKKL